MPSKCGIRGIGEVTRMARRAFRAKRKDRKKLRRRKKSIERRLDRRNFPEKPGVVFSSSGIRYEMADRIRATSAGGVGAAHMLARRVGLARAIDERLHLLERHMPYHESDHVLNIAYNISAGNTRLEDLELLRQDESYLDMLGAERIPAPTSSGDFLRRFSPEEIDILMDIVNEIRPDIWKAQPREFLRRAKVDADGTMAPTTGDRNVRLRCAVFRLAGEEGGHGDIPQGRLGLPSPPRIAR